MFSYRFDRPNAAVVWLFSGPSNADDDFARYVESFVMLDGEAFAFGPAPAGILCVDRENPMPNATWRREIARASRTLRTRPIIAFASESPLVRGIVTAVNWIRPPPYEFSVVGTFDEAVSWVEQNRGAPCPVFSMLMTELRAKGASR